MVLNPLLPRESRTPGDPQPRSGSPPSLQDPQSHHNPSPGWVELQSGMCLVRPVSSGYLLVTLQRTLSTRQGENWARADSQLRQGQSSGHTVTPVTSDLSQPEPLARPPPLTRQGGDPCTVPGAPRHGCHPPKPPPQERAAPHAQIWPPACASPGPPPAPCPADGRLAGLLAPGAPPNPA